MENILIRISLLCITLLMSSLSSVKAQDPLNDFTVFEKDDSRLNTTVTVWQSRVHLYKVLESLAQQSKVALEIDPVLAVSGMPLTVFCRERKLNEVMETLTSFLSVRGHPYAWRREGKQGTYRYRLEPSRAALEFHRVLMARWQTEFENHIDLLIRLAKISPEEREKSRDELLTSIGSKDKKNADYLLGSESFWEQVRLFDGLLSPMQQKRVLRREEAVEISLSEISADNIERFRRTQGDRSNTEPLFAANADASQSKIMVATIIDVKQRFDLTPKLFIGFKQSGLSSYFGLESSGFQENGVKNYLQEIWRLPNDVVPSIDKEQHTPNRNAPAPDGTTQKSSEKEFPVSHWVKPIEAIAASAQVPVIAQLISKPNTTFPVVSLAGRSWQEIENEARTSAEGLLVKWNGDFFLMRDPLWVQEEPYLLSAQVLKMVEAFLADKSSTLKAIVPLATKLTSQQREAAIREFPDVAPLPYLLELLNLTANAPDLLRSAGVNLTPLLVAGMKTLPQLTEHPLLRDQAASKARLMLNRRNKAGKSIRELRLELFAEKERRWIPVFGVPVVHSSK